MRNIAKLVAATVAASPLPDSFDDLDPQSQRHLTRRAESLGITAAAHYEQLKTATDASTADDELVRQIILSSGNR